VAVDPDKGDRLTFSDNTELFDIDPNTGKISFLPTREHIGKHQISVMVADKYNTTSTTIFELTITVEPQKAPMEKYVFIPGFFSISVIVSICIWSVVLGLLRKKRAMGQNSL
jgi:hypothetical protein